ncbi:MAG: single-stranded DNA-binding protein [Clostridia bacterium]|nr:single-stranded DNA-binding protein [Clostridia bacterium]
MLNSAIIMGRLTADPELRTTQSGLSVSTFTVAVERNYSGKDSERKTDFIRCVAWRQQAEFLTKYFGKGQMIAVQGTIQVRNYEDRNGIKREQTEIIVDNISFCGSKAESDAPARSSAPAQPAEPRIDVTADDPADYPDDDDLPF